MSKLNVMNVSDLRTENRKKDNKVNLQYFFITVADEGNPFTGHQVKITQRHSADGKTASWSGVDYNQAKALIGKQIEGEIVRAEVAPYQIEDRTATHFTCVVLKGQNLDSVLKQNGKKLSSSAPIVKEATV